MTNETMFKILSEIDERYIREARIVRVDNQIQPEREVRGRMNNKIRRMLRNPVLAAAMILLSVCVLGMTALGASGKLKGYFRDIFGWNGAVVGTAYEQATDEMELCIIEVSDQLIVEVTVEDPEMIPYRYFETFAITDYRIENMDGKTVQKGKTTESVAVVDGKAIVSIPLENLPTGEYRFVVSEMIGEKKADQPLGLHGTWVCEFERK